MGQPSEPMWARWRALIAEQQHSGQSVAAFCRERGLRDGQFYDWKKRLHRHAAEQPFVAVQIAATETPLPAAPAPSAPIELRLRHGRTLLVSPDFQAEHLRRLLHVLEQES